MIDVYISRIPDNLSVTNVYSEQRNEEIKGCKSEKVRMEKFWVWKTLEYGIKTSFGYNIGDVKFNKTESGKWVCDDFFFSLSHSFGVVAVALSDKPVGIDIESSGRFTDMAEKDIERIMKFAFTDSERNRVKSLSDFLRIWTAKESIFKCDGGKTFIPKNVDTLNVEYKFVGNNIFDGFFISVCAESDEKINFVCLQKENAN